MTVKNISKFIADVTADVRAIRTRQREAYETVRDSCAEIGTRVWVVRRGQYKGLSGHVLAKWKDGSIWKVKIDFGDRVVQFYARSVSRKIDGQDCECAEIQHSAHLLKYESGSFVGKA